MNRSEPSSCSQHDPAPFLVGRDSRGHWVVRQQDGKCGGLFVDRTAAIRFAMFENGRRAGNIVLVADGLELLQGDTGPAEPHQRAA